MTVYAVGIVKIKDREEYDIYDAQFLDNIPRYDGKILAAEYNANSVIGEWGCDRIVIVEFPDKIAFAEWTKSDEYRSVVQHRDKGADVSVILAEGVKT